jgi:hypothetical protein
MVYNFSHIKDVLDDYHNYCKTNIGYSKLLYADVLKGRNHDYKNEETMSEYYKISTNEFLVYPHYDMLQNVLNHIGILDCALVFNILHLSIGNFVNRQTSSRPSRGKSLGKFLSFSLTKNNVLYIKNKKHTIDQYHAIEFDGNAEYNIPPVKYDQTWAVFMVPNNTNIRNT